MHVALVACERLDAVELGDGLVVGREVPLADRAVRAELVELDECDCGQDVGEVGLVARNRDVVERAARAAHQPQVLQARGEVVAVRGDEPALAGRDVLRRVEREAGGVREPAELPAAIGALQGVRGVLDHGQAQRPERLEVARLPREMDGHDRLRALGDGLGDPRRIDVQVRVADVGEDGRGAAVDDHVRRRGPRDRARDHLVPRSDLERDEGEVQRGGPRRDGEDVLRLEVVREPLFELRRLRAGRQPAGADRLGDGGDLLLADGGGLEAEHRRPAGIRRERHRSGSV